MNRILIKPAKRWFGGRRQWKFELRAANGERVDPRDTYANRPEAIAGIKSFLTDRPVEIVIYDRYGNVEDREMLQ